METTMQPSTTRLSDAMLMGDGIRIRSPFAYVASIAGKVCGCAIGGAILAMGGSSESQRYEMWPWLKDYCKLSETSLLAGTKYSNLNDRYNDFDAAISFSFTRVCNGEISFEQLVDWVRRVEPEPAIEQDLDVEIPLTIAQIEAAQDAAENIEDLGTVGPFTAWI